MMFSATDFLPDNIRTLTNLATSWLPNFGSGRISRLGTSRRRGISIPFSLQLRVQDKSLLPLADGHHSHPLTRPITDRHISSGLNPTKKNYFLAALARLAPYFERACLRSLTPWVSRAPRTMW